MASGEGSMTQYLRLLARSGYTINDALNEHHRKMVEKHLLKPGSADLSPLGYDKRTPAIETIRFMVETGLVDKCLIVCPAAVIGVWERKLKEIAPELEMSCVRGSRWQKQKAMRATAKVFIISYSSLIYNFLKASMKWDLVVADEVHFIKNPKARRSQACYKLADRVSYRIALGSCLVNHLEDIWGICRFIDPSVFGKKFYEFKMKYFVMHLGPYPDLRPKQGAREMIIKRFKEHLGE